MVSFPPLLLLLSLSKYDQLPAFRVFQSDGENIRLGSYLKFSFFAANQQIMKKLFITIIIFAASMEMPAIAQDCKYFKEGKDKVTGEPFKESRNVVVKTYAFQLRKDGATKLSCSMDISIYGTSTYSITMKDTLYLKLENEEMVKLVPDKVYAPTKSAGTSGVLSRYMPTYKMTKEMLEKLAASPISKVRLSLENPVDGPTKKAEAQAIMKAAACLLVD